MFAWEKSEHRSHAPISPFAGGALTPPISLLIKCGHGRFLLMLVTFAARFTYRSGRKRFSAQVRMSQKV